MIELSEGFEAIPVGKLVFEERVNLNCFYCKRYNTQWTCPPRIPLLDYAKLIIEYDNKLFIKHQNQDRRLSTVNLHKELLRLEKVLWDSNNPLATSFIGGSCKLCKDGCNPIKCNNPGSARIPLEATGLNLTRILDIDFTKDPITRYGMILW